MSKPGPKEDMKEITNGKYWCRRMLLEHWPPEIPEGYKLPEQFVKKQREEEERMVSNGNDEDPD